MPQDVDARNKSGHDDRGGTAGARGTAREPMTQDTGLGILPGLLGYQLRHANLKVVGGFAERIAPHNVTAAQFGLLVLVAANPGATQAALARAFGTDRSVMVRLIDRLEAAGLVDRRAREGDRRSNAILLTERGAALLETLKREVRAFEEGVTACLTAEETETLLALLRRINAAARPVD